MKFINKAGTQQSAIATGLVDYELPPAGMPAQLIAYATHGVLFLEISHVTGYWKKAIISSRSPSL